MQSILNGIAKQNTKEMFVVLRNTQSKLQRKSKGFPKMQSEIQRKCLGFDKNTK